MYVCLRIQLGGKIGIIGDKIILLKYFICNFGYCTTFSPFYGNVSTVCLDFIVKYLWSGQKRRLYFYLTSFVGY